VTDWRPRPDAESGAPRLGDLLEATLLVPIRSSNGSSPDPARVPSTAFRHGADAAGAFLGAYTSQELLLEYGPPGTDHVAFPARDLFARAEDGRERLVIDPASPSQVEVPAAVLPFLAAGIDPTSPDAMAARRPHGELPPLEEPADVPAAFSAALRATLAELEGVQRAWLLRAGRAWTVGVELAAEASLADFDQVRNRLRTLAAEQLGAQRDLVVTDLRAPSMREAYDAVAGPFYTADRRPRGFLSRLLGND
jgi:hypothetical protein